MAEPGGINWDKVDWEKVDDAALALMCLTLHDGGRAWKGLSWEVTDRLHEKGLIHDPRGKAKSVVLTDDGLDRAEAAFRALFTKPD